MHDIRIKGLTLTRINKSGPTGIAKKHCKNISEIFEIKIPTLARNAFYLYI